MLLIGENIHIVSKNVKLALENKDENFVKNLIKFQQNFDAVDLNIGPAKGKLDNIFAWLINLCDGKKISFDSSNLDAIENALKLVPNPEECFINSTNADDDKLERLTDLSLKYNCNLIALAMSKDSGVPKNSDGRMELVLKIYEKCMEKGIDSEKIFFDPLVLPIKVGQEQGLEVLNTIKMIKESFEPKVNTIIGLSNISNGVAAEHRLLINRVFAVLCIGAGLDAVIADAKDEELYRIIKMIECNNPQNEIDKLYINLLNMVQCFGKVQDVEYNTEDKIQIDVIKTAKVLLDEEIYSGGLYVQ